MRTRTPRRKARGRTLTVVLLGLMLAGLLAACGGRVVPATLHMIDAAETRWQAAPVLSYRIVVDVERPDDRRRNELTVRDGEVTRAVARYWDARQRRWGEPFDLNPEQAFPFTVPGLFDIVREALQNSGRADVRVALEGTPPFPRRILLGPVWEGAHPVPGTEATVTVREFEPLH